MHRDTKKSFGRSATRSGFCAGRERGVSGKMISAVLSAGSTNAASFNYDNTNPTIATNAIYDLNCVYEAA
jgi:hypothetical protein